MTEIRVVYFEGEGPVSFPGKVDFIKVRGKDLTDAEAVKRIVVWRAAHPERHVISWEKTFRAE